MAVGRPRIPVENRRVQITMTLGSPQIVRLVEISKFWNLPTSHLVDQMIDERWTQHQMQQSCISKMDTNLEDVI